VRSAICHRLSVGVVYRVELAERRCRPHLTIRVPLIRLTFPRRTLPTFENFNVVTFLPPPQRIRPVGRRISKRLNAKPAATRAERLLVFLPFECRLPIILRPLRFTGYNDPP